MYEIDDNPEELFVDGEQAQEEHPAITLQSFIGKVNIVGLLDAETVDKIGLEVTRGYDMDKSSRADWEKDMRTALDLAMQIKQEKSWPWPKAANIKYPLITTAAIQFSARAYPAIVAGADVVKGLVIGPDPDGQKKERAERIGKHMSYQLLEDIEDWEEEEDKLLLMMAIVGCAFRKTYFNPMLGRPCSDLISANDVVYDHATPWKKLRRITHCLNIYKNDFIERVRGGLFTDIELGAPEGADNDEDEAFEFLEQHCWYDIDGDGYKEPYIVTVKKDSAKVCRIIPRFDEDGIYLNNDGEITKIVGVEYFTKYAFMPNPDGGSYDVGLGMLLNPINETVNTISNQILDAGTLANTGGGFLGSGLKMRGGAVKFAPGEFKPVDSTGRIGDNIYHMQFPGPSPVLFQMLGMLIDAGKDISSVKDIMTGDQQANQTATTTLALIEQGQKVFSAIYKRVHRSLKQEFKKLYRLNKLYMKPEDYYRYLDKAEPISLQDYQGDDTDVVPVSDPSLITDAQELTRAEALMRFINDPLINQVEIRKKYLTAIKIKDVDAMMKVEGQFTAEQAQQAQEQIQQAMQQIQQGQQQLQQGQQYLAQRTQQAEDQIKQSIQQMDKRAQEIALSEKNLEAELKDIAAKRRELALAERLSIEQIINQQLIANQKLKAAEAGLNEAANAIEEVLTTNQEEIDGQGEVLIMEGSPANG